MHHELGVRAGTGFGPHTRASTIQSPSDAPRTMDIRSTIKAFALPALILASVALSGCSTNLTGPTTQSEEATPSDQPVMSTGGDAEENVPIN